jgi:hypothetical protein
MNWTIIAAWSQLLGVVGVLGTLFFLVAQLRANTKAVRTQNIHHVTDSFKSMNLSIAADPSLADLYNRGIHDHNQLTPPERTQFAFMSLSAIRVYDTLYLHIKRGTGERELWESELGTLRYFFSLPGFQSWWTEQKFALAPASVRSLSQKSGIKRGQLPDRVMQN